MLEKRCYTVQELQEILGVSRPTIYNLLKKEESIPSHWGKCSALKKMLQAAQVLPHKIKFFYTYGSYISLLSFLLPIIK